MNDPLDMLHDLGKRARREVPPQRDVTAVVMRRLREPAPVDLPIRPLAACAGLVGSLTIVVVAAMQWWQPAAPTDGLDSFFQVASAHEIWRDGDVDSTR